MVVKKTGSWLLQLPVFLINIGLLNAAAALQAVIGLAEHLICLGLWCPSVYISPGNLPMLRIVAAQTLNLILLDAAARENAGTYSGATVERHTSLDCRATHFLYFARAAESRSIRIRVRVWAASFQSFCILSLVYMHTMTFLGPSREKSKEMCLKL
jgi:hypothetical protein